MPVDSIAVGQLFDGALQVFASDESTGWLYSTWKEGTDPNSAWSDWSLFVRQRDVDARYKLGVVAKSSRVFELFVLTLSGFPTYFPGYHGLIVTSMRKATTDSTSSWTAMSDLYPHTFDETKTGIISVAAAPLPDERLQVFMFERAVDASGSPPSRLMTSWKESNQLDAKWIEALPFEPQPPADFTSLAAAVLSSGQIQLWGAVEQKYGQLGKKRTIQTHLGLGGPASSHYHRARML